MQQDKKVNHSTAHTDSSEAVAALVLSFQKAVSPKLFLFLSRPYDRKDAGKPETVYRAQLRKVAPTTEVTSRVVSQGRSAGISVRIRGGQESDLLKGKSPRIDPRELPENRRQRLHSGYTLTQHLN